MNKIQILYEPKKNKSKQKCIKQFKIKRTSSLVDLSWRGGVAGDAWLNKSGSTLLVRVPCEPLLSARFYNRTILEDYIFNFNFHKKIEKKWLWIYGEVKRVVTIIKIIRQMSLKLPNGFMIVKCNFSMAQLFLTFLQENVHQKNDFGKKMKMKNKRDR